MKAPSYLYACTFWASDPMFSDPPCNHERLEHVSLSGVEVGMKGPLPLDNGATKMEFAAPLTVGDHVSVDILWNSRLIVCWEVLEVRHRPTTAQGPAYSMACLSVSWERQLRWEAKQRDPEREGA